MTSFFLFALFLLTVVLGRLRQLGTWRFSRLIPSMTFFRVALAAGLLSRLVTGFGLQGEIVDWIAVIAKTGLFVALAELALDLIWVVLARLSHRGVAPPRILKDLVLVAAAFVVVAAELNSQGVLTTVGSAAVLGGLAFIVGPGSATQIGNISSALAVQVERQFSVGDWVEIAGELGRVENISWNSTYLYDDIDDRYIVIPNSLIDHSKTINYSRPSSSEYRLDLQVGLPLEMPPGLAMQVLREALNSHPGIVDTARSRVVLSSIDQDSINYVLKFFVADFKLRNQIRTEIYSNVWYAIERNGYALPYSVIDLRTAQSRRQLQEQRRAREQRDSFASLRSIELFSSLCDDEIREIVRNDRLICFGPGEMVVELGDVGGSMYVVMEGRCSVLIPNPSGGEGMVEVAQLPSGTIFGEISALTNAPRTASIKAASHLLLQEISQQQIETIFLSNQEAMAEFAKVMASREASLKTFTPDETKSFEVGLVERMTQTFNKLMFS
mgnify:FL=1